MLPDIQPGITTEGTNGAAHNKRQRNTQAQTRQWRKGLTAKLDRQRRGRPDHNDQKIGKLRQHRILLEYLPRHLSGTRKQKGRRWMSAAFEKSIYSVHFSAAHVRIQRSA